MSEPIFYVNGKFVSQNLAFINVSDLGLLRGYGVFDFTRTYNRRPFRLDDHLVRLYKSAEAIGLDVPWKKDEIKRIIYRTLDRNPEGEQSLRIIITGGQSFDGRTSGDQPSLIIMVKPATNYPKEFFVKGVKIITYPGKRNIPEAKTLNYINGIKATKKANQEGAEDAIYYCDGVLLECTICSFFAVKNSTIITADKGVLDGITRRTVLELIEGIIPIEYRFLKVSEIPSFDEAFLTSSGHEIMPIITIDDVIIGDGKPGMMTKKIMKLFGEYTGRSLF